MKHRKSLIGLSLFTVLTLAVSWMVYVTLAREVEGTTQAYSAVFTDVSGLHAGDDVRVAGVRVGRVEKVELRGTVAKVTFRVQREQPLFTDTFAAVSYRDIIGQRYLGLSRPQAARHTLLGPGGEIPLERTSPSFDISYLLNGFEPLFTVLDPKQVDNLTNAIVEAFQGDNGSLLTLITETSVLAQSLAGPDDLLGGAITNLNNLVSNLSAQTSNLQDLIRETHQTLATFDDRRAGLVASTGAISKSVGRLATVVNNIFPDLQQLIRREPGWAQSVNDHPDSWAYLMQNFPLLLKGFARITQAGSHADGYFCNVNTTMFAFLSRVLPAVVKLASPGNVIQESAVCR
jgi:phospholipid/cholesterol/gamma-HCH transport system substrate-binding protein